MADAILCARGIYAIRNTVNGKSYVGSAVNIKKRWNNHLRDLRAGIHHSPRLRAAWAKYGEAAFVFEVLEHVAEKEHLLSAEQRWIDGLDSYESGYNATPTAGSPLGRKASDELRARLSAIHSGRKQDPAVVEKRAAALRGRKYTEEHKAKIAAAFAARKSVAGYVDPNTGRKQSAEHIANVQAARGVVRHDEETRRRISEAKKGKPITFKDPEARAKAISEAWRRRREALAATT